LLRGFGNFLIKELKQLVRDPKILLGMIIVPLVMFPILGAVMGYAVETAKESAVKASLVVVDNDSGEWSSTFIKFLLETGVKVFLENETVLNGEKIAEILSRYNTTQILEIPEGFSANITAHSTNRQIKASIRFYGVLVGTSVFQNVGSAVVDTLISQFNRMMAPDVLYAEKATVIKGEVKYGVDPAALSGLMTAQSIAMPIIIMILITYSVQVAATSVAMEKEEKTLETLLTLPVDRMAILFGKLSSSIIIAAIGALAYMVGYGYMMGMLMGQIPQEAAIDLSELGLAPSSLGYLLLGLSLFVTLLSALALAVILSAFAEDVRGAQAFVGYIYPLIFVPAFALMYIDINMLPLAVRALLYAIPFSHPIIASKAIMMGDHLTPVFGIIYGFAFTMVIMYIVSRLFATEKILTVKLKMKGFRRCGAKPPEEV